MASTLPPIRDLAYIAGVLEADGCFTEKHGTPVVVVGMTDEDVVRRLQRMTGSGKVNGPYLNRAGHNVKPMWHWSVDRQHEAYALMVAVYGFLGERRQQRISEILKRWIARPIPNKFKSRCNEGHALVGDNLYLEGTKRRCRTCRASAARRLRARRAVA